MKFTINLNHTDVDKDSANTIKWGWTKTDVNWNAESLHDHLTTNSFTMFRLEGSYLKGANAVDTELMVVDRDDPDDEWTMDKTANYFKEQNLSFALVTTTNHQQDKKGVVCDRYRIIIPLSKPVMADDVNALKHYAQHLPFKVDLSVYDRARYFYRCPADAVFQFQVGELLDPDKLLEDYQRAIADVAVEAKLDVMGHDERFIRDKLDSIIDQGIDITYHYEDYRNVCFGLLNDLPENVAYRYAQKFAINSDYLFNQQDFDRDWQGFLKHKKPQHPITLATVFYLAKQAGWVSPKNKSSDYSTLSSALQSADFIDSEAFVQQMAKARLDNDKNELLLNTLATKSGKDKASLQERYNAFAAPKTNHLADEVLNQFGKDRLVYALSSFWFWTGGIWLALSESEINREIHFVCQYFNIDPNSHRVTSVRHYLRDQVRLDDKLFNQIEHRDYLLSANGKLCFNGDDWQLEPFQKTDYLTALPAVTFDPEAQDCPTYDKFMQDILSGYRSDEQEEVQKLIEAYFGYCFIPRIDAHLSLILYGTGSNGKSTLLNLLVAAVGKDNASNIALNDLSEEHNRATLQGKFINHNAELSRKALDDARIKDVIAGDTVTARHKYGHPFSFVPFAKHVFATNNLPASRDRTDGLYRRFAIVELKRQFKPSEQDYRLIDKLIKELPAIFNRWLAAYAEVIENEGKFNIPACIQKQTERWRIENDSAWMFANECLQLEDGLMMLQGDMRKCYEAYCKMNGTHPLSAREFNRTFENNLKLKREQKKVNGKNKKIWAGVALKQSAVDELRDTSQLDRLYIDNAFTYNDELDDEPEHDWSSKPYFSDMSTPIHKVASSKGPTECTLPTLN